MAVAAIDGFYLKTVKRRMDRQRSRLNLVVADHPNLARLNTRASIGTDLYVTTVNPHLCREMWAHLSLKCRVSLDQPRHAELRITLQKLPRWKLGSLSASTSAFTFPKVVSGLCLMPS
jgi:hypothetical protein